MNKLRFVFPTVVNGKVKKQERLVVNNQKTKE